MIDTTKITQYDPPLPIQTARGVYNYMGTPMVYGLIRHLCKETGGPYLEIGSYRGMSLLAAGADTGVKCIGIDNFTEIGHRPENKTILLEQIAPYGNISLYNADFREALKAMKKEKARFSVVFVDGPHGYEDTIDQIRMSEKLLDKSGYIIIDDLNFAPVEKAMRDFLETGRGKKFDTVFFQKTSDRNHPIWWNGIAVIQKG